MQSDIITRLIMKHQGMLPKIKKEKKEEVNDFLKDPTSVLKQIFATHHLPSDLESFSSQNPKVKRKNHRSNPFLVPSFLSPNVDDMKEQRQLISAKLQKFQPKNGSHSPLYADQKALQHRKDNQFYGKIRKPDFTFKSLSKAKLPKKFSRKSHSLEKAFSLSKDSKNTFTQKISSIREVGALLRANSRSLYKKTHLVKKQTNLKYEKLKDYSEMMISGEQKYKIDQQVILPYRNQRGHRKIRDRWVI